MNCSKSEELIQKSLDGQLSSDERRRLDAHLAECAACRAAWDEYRRLGQTTAAWTQRAITRDDPGDAFTAQVMAQIASQQQSANPSPQGRVWTWGAAALALLAGASYWVGPLLPLHTLPLSFAWNVPEVEWAQTLSSLMHGVLSDWDTLTAHQDLPRWVWSALAVTLAANGGFAWRALRPARETASR